MEIWYCSDQWIMKRKTKLCHMPAKNGIRSGNIEEWDLFVETSFPCNPAFNYLTSILSSFKSYNWFENILFCKLMVIDSIYDYRNTKMFIDSSQRLNNYCLIQRRIQNFILEWFTLNSYLMWYTILSTNLKIRIYRTLIKPVVTYGSET